MGSPLAHPKMAAGAVRGVEEAADLEPLEADGDDPLLRPRAEGLEAVPARQRPEGKEESVKIQAFGREG